MLANARQYQQLKQLVIGELVPPKPCHYHSPMICWSHVDILAHHQKHLIIIIILIITKPW